MNEIENEIEDLKKPQVIDKKQLEAEIKEQEKNNIKWTIFWNSI